MPTLPDILLQKPKVLILPSASVAGFESAGVALNFGTIQNIFSTSDKFSTGDSVLFDPGKCMLMNFSGNVFYVANENDLFFTELPAV